jgi:hypothetical protein
MERVLADVYTDVAIVRLLAFAFMDGSLCFE